MMSAALEKDLVELLGRGQVSRNESDLSRYGGDALGVFRAFTRSNRLNERAGAVVWPENVEGISRILKYATRTSAPVVPYGGGTGVMGAAATAVESAIIVHMGRMNSVVEVDAKSRTGTFQAGIALESAHRALKSCGLRLGHDPWSRPIATIGGAISTNGVGYTASGHGAMGDQVLGMRVLLSDGEIVETRAVPETFFGASLNHLFIGTEGGLGIVAEATLRAFPIPERREMLSFDFPEFEAGYAAINSMYAQGMRPIVMDYGDELASDGSGRREMATLYLSFEGGAKIVEANVDEAAALCVRHNGRRGDRLELKRYWASRHESAHRYRERVLQDSAPDVGRPARRMDYLHVSLPAGRVLEYRKTCQTLLAATGVEIREWSVWGRPEFFSFLIAQENVEPDGDSLGDVVNRVLTLAQDMGGSMEYCHGVGLKLAHLAEAELGSGITAARRIKNSLDPAGILNPGKMWG